MSKARWGKIISSVVMSVVLSLSLILTGCGASTQGTTQNAGSGQENAVESDLLGRHIVIGTMATEDILPMWVAEAEGIFDELGLTVDIETFQSAQELSTAIVAGAVDLAMTDIMVSATLSAAGTPVSMEWVTLGAEASQGRFGIMTSPDSGITSLKELEGVGIGVGSCTVPEYVMDMLMKEAGISDDDIVGEEIKKVPVRYEMMSSNQVAAAALPASFLALGEQQGMVCLADDSTGDNLSQSVMIMESALANTEVGAAMVRELSIAWDKAVALINANPESYRQLLITNAQLPDEVKDTYPISQYPLAQKPTTSMVEPVITWMLDKEYLEAALHYDEATGQFSK